MPEVVLYFSSIAFWKALRVNIPRLIVDFMLSEHLLIPSRNLSFGMILTRLFKKTDLSSERVIAPSININSTLLTRIQAGARVHAPALLSSLRHLLSMAPFLLERIHILLSWPKLMIYLWISLLPLRRYWQIRINFDRSIVMICHTSAHSFVLFRDAAMSVSPGMIDPFLFLMIFSASFTSFWSVSCSVQCIQSLSSCCWSS